MLRTVILNNIPAQLLLMLGSYGRKDMREIQLSSGLIDKDISDMLLSHQTRQVKLRVTAVKQYIPKIELEEECNE